MFMNITTLTGAQTLHPPTPIYRARKVDRTERIRTEREKEDAESGLEVVCHDRCLYCNIQ